MKSKAKSEFTESTENTYCFYGYDFTHEIQFFFTFIQIKVIEIEAVFFQVLSIFNLGSNSFDWPSGCIWYLSIEGNNFRIFRNNFKIPPPLGRY